MADYHSEAQNNTGALHENQAVPTPANTVGEEFARQFYHVLTQVPHLAHRFYNDTSKLTYSGGPGPSITVHGQQDINNQILSLNLSGAQIEVLSVDAQYSLQGGVTVLVTGRISAGQVPKSFVQTFFLATQEKGYYVLNDTFRYMSDPAKSQSSTYSDASTNGNPQQYPMQHEANGYGNTGRASSAGAQHNQPQPPHATPPPPQTQPSAFQQVNGHTSSTHTSQDLGAGQTSGDLPHSPSPAGSQGLPPPPPRPSAPPTQQTPPSPPQESSEPEQPPQQAQQPSEEKEPSDQLVAQPAVNQNRPPVKSQRKPSTPAPQAAATEASAPATTPSKTPLSYADLLRQRDSSAAQPVTRPQTPSQPSSSATLSAQPAASSATTAPLPQRNQGSRQQNRAPAASAGSASSDQSAKENQPANQVQDRSSQGPPSRPPYGGPQGQGYRDDESSKRAVFVTNIPEEATSDELRELFSQFGVVKTGSGAVTLKKYSGNGKGPFAYLDFADAASAQAAIDASTVEFKGVELKIQAKRPQNVYSSGRGRGGSYGMRGGYNRGRGNDRNFSGSGRGNGPVSVPDAQAEASQADRGQAQAQGQGVRATGRGGQGGGQMAGRGRGGRDGGRGRGRGPSRQTSMPSIDQSSAPPAISAE